MSGFSAAAMERGGYADFDWTPAAVDILTAKWGLPGVKARDIAIEIGCPSRNSVISKAHRLGLKKLESPIKPVAKGSKELIRQNAHLQTSELAARTGINPKTVRGILNAPHGARKARPAQPRKAPPAAAAMPATAPSGPGIEVGAQSRFECSAPLWDDATPIDDRRVCGARIPEGRSAFCAYHAAQFLARPRQAAVAEPAPAAAE